MPAHDPKSPPLPTEAEMEILAVLWKRGPSTVREVFAEIAARRDLAYTTVLKFLQIMIEKGLVRRDESKRTHVYVAASHEERTQQRMMRDLLDRVFGGSKQKLILQALSATRTSVEELDQIRRLMEQKRGTSDNTSAKGDAK